MYSSLGGRAGRAPASGGVVWGAATGARGAGAGGGVAAWGGGGAGAAGGGGGPTGGCVPRNREGTRLRGCQPPTRGDLGAPERSSLIGNAWPTAMPRPPEGWARTR